MQSKKKTNFLSILRYRLGLTQKELANILGVHVFTIRRWEKEGKTICLSPEQMKTFFLLLKKNNISVEEVLDLFL